MIPSLFFLYLHLSTNLYYMHCTYFTGNKLSGLNWKSRQSLLPSGWVDSYPCRNVKMLIYHNGAAFAISIVHHDPIIGRVRPVRVACQPINGDSVHLGGCPREETSRTPVVPHGSYKRFFFKSGFCHKKISLLFWYIIQISVLRSLSYLTWWLIITGSYQYSDDSISILWYCRFPSVGNCTRIAIIVIMDHFTKFL